LSRNSQPLMAPEKFVTMFTTDRQWKLSGASWIQSHPVHTIWDPF